MQLCDPQDPSLGLRLLETRFSKLSFGSNRSRQLNVSAQLAVEIQV
jgi:hypothetical protein